MATKDSKKNDQYYDAWVITLSIILIVVLVVHMIYTGGLPALLHKFFG